jgi:hypothetical protein
MLEKTATRKPMSDTAWEFVSAAITSVSTGVIAFFLALLAVALLNLAPQEAYGSALGAFGGALIVANIGAVIKVAALRIRNRAEA